MIGGLVGGLILALSNSPMYAISMGVTGVMCHLLIQMFRVRWTSLGGYCMLFNSI